MRRHTLRAHRLSRAARWGRVLVPAACIALALISLTALLVPGCNIVPKVTRVGTEVARGAGVITDRQAVAINRSTEAVAKTFQDITPEQEYYIGRSIAARIMATYAPYRNEKATLYLNRLGQTLAAASDRPETFRGYHFLILDSQDINAFAAPGGLVLVTRGLMRCCDTEDALAAVLAHEIGHVQGKHGLRAIKRGRLTQALRILATESAGALADKNTAELTDLFEDSLGDIASELVNNGYSRELEVEADQIAVTILTRVGYNPRALVDMLGRMQKRLKPGGLDFAKTHPSPADRIAAIRPLVGSSRPVAAPPARQTRFEQGLAGI